MKRTLTAILGTLAILTTSAFTLDQCTEGGSAPDSPRAIRIRFEARGTPKRVHVHAVIGTHQIVDGAKKIPWRSGLLRVQPSEAVELTVTQADEGDHIVACAILDQDGNEMDSDSTRSGSVSCYLAPLSERIKAWGTSSTS